MRYYDFRMPRPALRLLPLCGVLITFACASMPAASARTASDVPSVMLDYSSLLDMPCAMRSGRPLDSALVEHAIATVPAYRAQWAARGPELLRSEASIVGQPFVFHETTAALVTCGLPSMSFPLILNVQSFLRGRAGTGGDAGEMTEFVNTLWHELSHRYVEDILRPRGRRTPLLEKYAGETPVTRSHLHLFAIQELVYRQLGLQKELDLVFEVERGLMNGGNFARAHEIVAKEGAEAFVRELREGP